MWPNLQIELVESLRRYLSLTKTIEDKLGHVEIELSRIRNTIKSISLNDRL